MRQGVLFTYFRASLVLTAVFALASGLGAILVLARSVPEPLLPVSSAIEPVVVSLPESQVLEASVIAERPLFWETRRRYTPTATVQEPQGPRRPDPFDDAAVVGIFASGRDAGVILDVDGKRERVLLGDDWQGWELTGMKPDEATFRSVSGRSAGQERTLQLEHALVKSSPVGNNGKNTAVKTDKDAEYDTKPTK